MKKKIINGILLVAMLFATSSAFVSCKDNDADVNTELKGQYNSLQQQLAALQSKVDGLKSCNCDLTSINAAITALQNAVKDLENGKPIDLSNYVTNDALKAAIAGIDLSKYATEDELKAAIAGIDLSQYAKADDVNATLGVIGLAIAALEANIEGTITNIGVQATDNPVYGMLSLPGFRPNILAAYYGEATEDVLFPAKDIANGAEQIEIVAGQKLLNGNAGKIYLTLNPNNVSLEGKTLSLVNTQGTVAPIVLSNLQPSNKILWEGWTRADNGFYEADGILTEENIAAAEPYIDVKELASDVKNVVQKRNAAAIQSFVTDLYTTASKITPRYAVKASWGMMSTTSDYDVNAIAIKPLAYTFDLNISKTPGIDRIESFINGLINKIQLDFNVNIPSDVKIGIKDINLSQQTITVNITTRDTPVTTTVNGERVNITVPGQTISETIDITAQMQGVVNDLMASLNNSLKDVNDLLENVQDLANVGVQIEKTKNSIKDQINGYLEAINKRFVNLVNNANKAIQPTLLVKNGNKIQRARGEVAAGTVTLYPTSWSAELLAPAYKKFVVVTNDKSANKGDLGKVIDGSVTEIELNVEKGKTYEITYSAVDFFGNVVTNEYTFTGK